MLGRLWATWKFHWPTIDSFSDAADPPLIQHGPWTCRNCRIASGCTRSLFFFSPQNPAKSSSFTASHEVWWSKELVSWGAAYGLGPPVRGPGGLAMLRWLATDVWSWNVALPRIQVMLLETWQLPPWQTKLLFYPSTIQNWWDSLHKSQGLIVIDPSMAQSH